MNIFQLFKKEKYIGPQFKKRTNDATTYLEFLIKRCNDEEDSTIKEQIQKQIYKVSAGIKGEDKISYELSMGGQNMYILHDLNFEINGLTAQIDFIVITNKLIFVLESKYNNDNIGLELNENGYFLWRMTDSKGNWIGKPQTMQNPITQNERHLVVLKEIIRNDALLSKYINEKRLVDIVVLSNYATKLYAAKSAPSDIKSKIVGLELLNREIIKRNKASSNSKLNLCKMEELANSLLKNSSVNKTTYEERLKNSISRKSNNTDYIKKSKTTVPKKLSDNELTAKLKEYRTMKSKAERKKPYLIFKDNAIEGIIKKRPKTLKELKAIEHIGEKTINQYGEDLLKIIQGESL